MVILSLIFYHKLRFGKELSLMNTIVKNWQIVSIVDGQELVGRVLWAIVIDDTTCRFKENEYVCTSSIKSISIERQLIFTESGSVYQIIGDGVEAEVEFCNFELLRNGFSPEQINQLKLAPNDYLH